MIVRFALPTLLLLCALAWGAAELVESKALRWFEEDLAARAQLGAGADDLAAAEAVAADRALRLHHLTLLLFAGFGLVTIPGMVLARRYFWRRWTIHVRDLINNKDPPGRYAPVLRDLRDQLDRIARRGAGGPEPSPRED